MKKRLIGALGVSLLLPVALWSQGTSGPTVRFHTNLGDIDVLLLPESAPNTVQNFLNYVNRGSYNNSIIHRSVPGFVIQGGGYQMQGQNFVPIPEDPPVRNEFRLSNTRGTLAMAKVGGDPHSATSQWFFNLANNSQNLNSNNGGFTVFGRIANSTGLGVMDRIAAVPVYEGELPLINYRGGALQESNMVIIRSVEVLAAGSPAPAISEGGVITASSFGAIAAAAPGSFIEIYGANLAGDAQGWANSDFTNGKAPTTLGEVSVTVNGQPAFVNYVSATQVNVQVPANVPTGGSVPVIVTYKGQASSPVMLPIRNVVGGLLAPPAFKVGDKQYVATYNAQTGAPVTSAMPGETLLLYGTGFGPVIGSNTPIAGEIAQGTANITTPVQFHIGELQAQVQYAGLVPGLVGVYQFNVVVPMNASSGDQPLRVVLGGETLPQTILIPIGTRN